MLNERDLEAILSALTQRLEAARKRDTLESKAVVVALEDVIDDIKSGRMPHAYTPQSSLRRHVAE
jgi:hypothetical protein